MYFIVLANMLVNLIMSSFLYVTLFVFITGALTVLLSSVLSSKNARFVKTFINDKPSTVDTVDMFSERHANALDTYSSLIKKQLINDNFMNVFRSYYPDCVLTKSRIEKVIKKYIFSIGNESVPLSVTSIHRAVNQLTRKTVKEYICTDSIRRGSDDLNDWTDLTFVLNAQSLYRILTSHVAYLMFYVKMRTRHFVCVDVPSVSIASSQIKSAMENLNQTTFMSVSNSSVRLWINKDRSVYHTGASIVFLDTVNYNNCDKFIITDRSDRIYAEVKGLSNYSQIFDILTFDRLNEYPDLLKVSKMIGVVLDFVTTLVSDSKSRYSQKHRNVHEPQEKCHIDVELFGASTMLTPYIVDLYNNIINDIYVVDPVFYPHSYHTFFTQLRVTNCQSSKLSSNFVRMFHNLSLIDLYFNRSPTDKSSGVYGRNVHVGFSDESEKFTDRELLTILLNMYSKVYVVDTLVTNLRRHIRGDSDYVPVVQVSQSKRVPQKASQTVPQIPALVTDINPGIDLNTNPKIEPTTDLDLNQGTDKDINQTNNELSVPDLTEEFIDDEFKLVAK
ncbi:hypothetical protein YASMINEVIRUS_348 [Yasminevirus sp. GU-2018]|uniref:Uncharacterized protein n=1 Tax=Yasminevirus sp. GU-2018 TaxID=2420051 RepID=A0A5K0U7X2_9VIRU|nr:hypothetical protein YASMINEVIRUS_348 [Yasminevirus sp. GU-2018]